MWTSEDDKEFNEEYGKDLGTKNDTETINPKDAVGIRKVPMSAVPLPVLYEVGLAMLEGCKYGRHNYRIAGVRASVYYDALWRHIGAWWEGEDIDEKSGLPHIVKAIATLVVLRDSQIAENWVDDRPPIIIDSQFWDKVNENASAIVDSIKEPIPAYTQIERRNENG